MIAIRATPNPWYADVNQICELARELVDRDVLATTKEVLWYFEKPWKYSQERDHIHGLDHDCNAKSCLLYDGSEIGGES